METRPEAISKASAAVDLQATPPKIFDASSNDEAFDRNTVGTAGAKRLILLIAVLSLVFAVVRLLRQPTNVQESCDSEAFRKALRDLAPEIQKRADTPREMRRFMNYLRFITGSDSNKPSETASFEPQLVELVARGVAAQAGKINSKIIEYYRIQCELIGIDAETFQLRDE